MKAVLALIAMLLVVLVSVTEAGNAPHQFVYDESDYVPTVPVRANRQRRVPCELGISTPWITFNDSLCAAHCLALRRGFRNGYCENGVCVCQK